MHLLSANLEYTTAWTRVDEVAALIGDAHAEVVAIQECPEEPALAALADRLGFTYRMGPSPSGLHTALLWAPHVEEVHGGDKYEDKGVTWHGFTSSTLRGPRWPCPITFICAHLVPHDVDAAVGEARFLQTRVHRQGWPGVLLGDVNHGPLAGPEPDWDQVPEHNRASRTILDQDQPDKVRLDRRVGLALTRGKMIDVAAHLADLTGREELLAYTGVHGLLRTDQVWVTRQLAGAIAGYARLDHRGVSDHHPIAVDLAIEDLAPIPQVAFH
ncbi:endonuclease/exonuclease/phosphatase family protein [Nocardiopsis synnemataformans]|uniref:endonuclease/exonuclease/phosphatase family protein n=1 Tax=Nocardiopsis synnemataformans TaxID=61305 RepID=UPI003EBB0E65